ncbi:retrovirus-related pol polyprotein from transposon TNT 1-94 [Tanacetum coccineum]
MKNKVEAQPRKVNKKNCVVKPIHDVDVKHSLLNANSKPICAACKKYMFDGVHDMCFLEFVKNVNSRAKSAKKHKKENIWKPTGHVFTEVGFKWKPTGKTFTIVGNSCPLTRITSANVVPPKITTSHSVEIQKPELKVYSRKSKKNVKNVEGVDLLSGSHDTNLYTVSLDDMLKTSSFCLLSKASKTKGWLWHRSLSHLNFGTINRLAKDGLARGIPRLKFQKDHLFLRTKDEASEAIIKCIKNIQVHLNATVRNVRTDNGTEFVNQTLREIYENVGITHQTSVARTPQQNGIDKKPDLSFFHVFGALCYPTNDNDDLGKLDAKANIGIFVGYAPAKKAFRINNKRSLKIIETINVTFDELTTMASEQFSSVLGLQYDWDRLFQPMFDEYFTPISIVVTPVQEAAAPRAVTSVEPKNFKQAMTEPSWIDAMHEEIHDFNRSVCEKLLLYDVVCEELERHGFNGLESQRTGRQMLLVGGETENVPLYYHMYDNFQIQFGREEFCLVTGLKFEVEYLDYYDGKDKPIPFWRRVFPSRLDGKCITEKDLVLLGLEDRRLVPNWILRLEKDRDGWDDYPWGSYVWPTLYYNLKDANVKRWLPLYAIESINEDGKKSYSILGFTWAFKTWILEVFRLGPNEFYTRHMRYPRIVAWTSNKKFYRPMLRDFLHGRVPAERLIPDEVEAGSGWWLSSRAYFDGCVTERERRPPHLNRENHYEVPSDIYREFQEQRSGMDQMMKQGQNIVEAMKKYMEELNVDTLERIVIHEKSLKQKPVKRVNRNHQNHVLKCLTCEDKDEDNENDFDDLSDEGDDDNDGNNDDDDDANDDDEQEGDDTNDDDEETDSDITESDRIKIPILDQSTTEYYEEEEEKIDDEETMYGDKDDEVTKELYEDVNVNLGNEDTEMTNADQGGADQQNVSQQSGFELVEEDAHVTLTPLLNLDNPSLVANEIASLMDNTTHHATTIPKITSSFTTTIPLPPPFFNPLPQQSTPTPTPTTSEATTSFPALLDFTFYAQALSSIPAIVDRYMDNKLGEAINKAIQAHNFDYREEAQAEKREYIELVDSTVRTIIKEEVNTQLPQILPQAISDVTTPLIKKNVTESLEAAILTRSSSQPQSSYEAAATLSEFELIKILIDKMEKNKSYDVADHKRELYDALVNSYQIDKDLFDSYGEVISLKRSQDERDKDRDPSAGSDRGTKRRKSSKDAESSRYSNSKEKNHTVEDSRMQQDQEFVTEDNDEQPTDKETWISQVARAKEPPTSFDKLNDTSFDFSTFVMNRLKIPNLTQEILGRDLSRRYSTFVTKTKAATYELKWIKDLVPELWSPVQLKYDQHAYLGTSHWGPKCQSFYGYASNLTSSKDVYSRRRIITVTRLQIMKKYDYGHLEEIEVYRDDQKLYKFKEGDFKRLRLQDIEDMLLLIVQQKLTNLTIDERSNLRNKTAYTSYSDPHGIIYVDRYMRKRLMRADELYKFSDGMLNDVRSALHDIATGIRMEYLPMRKWSNLDKKRARVMVQDIDKQLYQRRLMRNLEKFVGGREYENDLRLLERTI